MNFRHLRYFVVLADELHFGRAAKRLAISQPPLSFNIKQLEISLGVTLFERSSKGVKLTLAGESFREAARRMLEEADHAKAMVRQVAAGAVSRIRIGLVGSMLYRGLPELLRAYQHEFPRVEIVLTELNSAEQIDALLRGKLDLGFVHSAYMPQTLDRLPYRSEPFVCCLPSGHPSAGADEIHLATLSEEPFVLFSKVASPDYYERILALCSEQGLQPRVKHEMRHWLSVVSMVSKGMGVALVPKALATSGIPNVCFVPVQDSKYRSDVYCVWDTNNLPSILPPLLDVIRRVGQEE